MEVIKALFRSYTGCEADICTEIVNSGSNRRYYRVGKDGKSVIGVFGAVEKENRAFIEFSRHFKSKGINVPQILAVSEDFLYYLTEDLGATSLFDTLKDPDINLLERTVSALPKIQFEGGAGLDYSLCFPQSEFDRRTVFWDLNYFKYEFLKPSGLEFDEARLEDDFETLASMLLKECGSETFMYRDFQSRNVMVKDGEPWFIDYQGGRKGPVYYDLASFVYQAKANYSPQIRERLISAYMNAASQYMTVDENDFRSKLAIFTLFRTMQVLGAYGFRGLVEHKAHFIQSIPPALRNLSQLIEETDMSQLPYLKEVLLGMIASFDIPEQNNSDKLLVRVYSFSYKKGIPTDYSGNGGGYVFDCRAVHNPGRYAEYKKLTGRDMPVIDFLEENGEITSFLDNVYALADAHVERYIRRGFTNLMFSFGCTGGQHRSVYAAQHLAEHIATKFGVKVVLEHREQKIKETL